MVSASPRLSVGLPVYNGETYIGQSIESLLGQSYEDFELIISDNASTDSTADICRHYGKQDPRIRYVRQPRNIGLSPNHNFVVQQARGEYFKWAAADDLCAPTFLFLAGFSLYMITSDHGHQFGCKATTVQTVAGPFLCTGPSNDHNAEWPAITTKGAPVAGPGVNPALLGSVRRLHVGRQVTYAGHPLYLFDEFPGAVSGESWDEPGLPPWHGIWTLVAPSGKAAPWAGTLTVTTLPNGRKVVAAQMNTGIGTINFPCTPTAGTPAGTARATPGPAPAASRWC